MSMLQLLQIVPPPSEPVRFGDLKPGEVFKLPRIDNVYVKVDADGAFSFDEWQMERYSHAEEVVRVVATLRWCEEA